MKSEAINIKTIILCEPVFFHICKPAYHDPEHL